MAMILQFIYEKVLKNRIAGVLEANMTKFSEWWRQRKKCDW